MWARSDGHVEARIVDSERTALEPELGALDRGELMEDGVRIWWSSGNSGENFKIHLVGSLVLKEGPYAMSLTHDFWVYREQREKFCTLYYQRLTHEWLQRRRRISLDGLDFWCGFDFENEKFLIDRDRVGEPFRNYIGMRLTVRLRTCKNPPLLSLLPATNADSLPSGRQNQKRESTVRRLP